MAKKTWIEKRDAPKFSKVKLLEKKFADIEEGSKMFIATPKIIDDYLRAIPLGQSVDLKTMRMDLALSNNADMTCPVTTGIFLRIVSEAALEELVAGIPVEHVTPFWRVVEHDSKLAFKLNCEPSFIQAQRELEGI